MEISSTRNKRGWQLWLTCVSRTDEGAVAFTPNSLRPMSTLNQQRNPHPWAPVFMQNPHPWTPITMRSQQYPRRRRSRQGDHNSHSAQHGFDLGPSYGNNFTFAFHHMDLDIRHSHLPTQKRQSRFFPSQKQPTPSSEPSPKHTYPSLHQQSRERTVSPTLSNLDGYPELQRTISPLLLPSPISLPTSEPASPSDMSEPTFSGASTLVDEQSSASVTEI